ncbi:MAG: hypothetical protein U0228_30755 [Myxococcaceae bacterium]
MTSATDGVVLAQGETGSAFFHRVLSEGISRDPAAFTGAHFPTSGKAFKHHYGDTLARYEAARVASSKRIDLAWALHDATLGSLRFSKGGQEVPLLQSLSEVKGEPRKTQALDGTWSGGLVPELPLDGTVHRGVEPVRAAVAKLLAAHHLTHAAARALNWLLDHVASQGGALDLRAQRFVLFGASAELSPVSLLLGAGATVRWIDVKPPARDAAQGKIVSSEGGDDLLVHPHAAMAAVREFASDGPVHLGLFAYAPGASRELRLAGVMDAIAHTLGHDVVKSVSFYISPTSPGAVQPEDLEVMNARGKAPKLWQRGFAATRMLRGPGHEGEGENAVARGVISLQGAAYQAAQYLMKIISGEVLATRGLSGQPITLSANVAGITNTRSLSHPLFQIAFQGAPQFGVRIFEPPTTRAISGLLMLADLLNPAAPGSATKKYESPLDRVRATRSEQIHGGTYDLPWQFESAVKTAAVLGLGKRPDLLVRRKKH